MLKLLEDAYENILTHAKDAYPHECCGVLGGRGAEVGCAEAAGVTHGKLAIEAVRLTNTNVERAADRFEIDPAELLKVEKELAEKCLDVIGFYHSHPDHPARPSEFDRERGWPEYSYVIVAVKGGKETESTCWTFKEMDEPFRNEQLNVGDHMIECGAECLQEENK